MEAIDKILKSRHPGQKYQEIIRQVMNDPDVQQFLHDHRDELTTDNVVRGHSKLYEFVHEKHLGANNIPGVAPGYSPRLVVAAGQIDVTYVPTKGLIAQQRRKAVRDRVSNISMPKFIQNASFSNYYLDEEHNNDDRQKALQRAIDFVNNYSLDHFEPGLYLSGNFGVGKTFLLGAIANELAKKGVKTTLVHFPSFAVQMKGSISKNTTDELRDRVRKAPVLMIDDIGADALSPWLRDDVLGVILEYRMQEELPTFFSSNFTMDTLTDHLAVDTNGNQEPLKARRIMERIRFLSREVPMSGANLRKKGNY